MDFIRTFATDPRIAAICLLILIDLITGVAAALRTHTFAGDRLWAFLGTDVLKLGGVAVLYALTAAGLLAPLQALGVDPGFGVNATVWSLTVIAIGSLLTSARNNLERGGWLPKRDPVPPQP